MVIHTCQPGTSWINARRLVPRVAFVILLAAASLRLYNTPLYDMDMLGYMGNALLEQDTDPLRIHAKVYAEIARELPPLMQQHLTGQQSDAPESQNNARRDRARNPYHFAEFLPCFAIRPVYNQSLYLLSRTGFTLVKASVFISVVSYFLIGLLVFTWMSRYVDGRWAALLALLIMISPPLTQIGRFTGADGVSTLLALSGLYLVFEKQRWTLGLTVLLFSIYVRTDNVVLAVLVILTALLTKKTGLWHAAVLLVLGVSSVLLINYFAGDYGIRMLYYRNFVGTPLAPGETTIMFSAHDYFVAFRKGMTDATQSFLIPFLVIGLLGFVRSNRMRSLGCILIFYTALHFILLPNWQERWFGVFYVGMGILGAMAMGDLQDRNLSQSVDS